MSQSSVTDQVKDLQSAGFPVRQGVRKSPTEDPADLRKFGSDLWLSRWSRNAFRNYPIVSRSYGIRFLHEACHGIPCFIVGVGPSLDAAIPDLKLAQKRSLIIATDAALRALLANGITPDLVVSYDCKEDQKRLWDSIPKAPPCLFNSCTHPDSIASWPGPIMFFNQYHTQDDLAKLILPCVFPEIGQIPSSGTVGNMATLAAHAMGCNPICTVGMDFAYQPVNETVIAYRYRAQDYQWMTNRGAGVPDGWEKTEIKELYDNDERLSRSFIVKGDEGKQYRVDPELVFYLDSFKDLMAGFKVPIVNCTPDGRIPTELIRTENGVEIKTPVEKMSVSQAIERFCKKEHQAGRSVIPHLSKILPDVRTK